MFRDRCGTVPYMTPEQLLGKDYNYTVDYWSYGIALYFLMCRKYPFTPQKNYSKMFEQKLAFDKEVIGFYTKELIDFVK